MPFGIIDAVIADDLLVIVSKSLVIAALMMLSGIGLVEVAE